MIVQGNFFFDNTNQPNPSVYIGSGAVTTYGAPSGGPKGGGVRVTASGSSATDIDYLVASYQIPTFYQSGALIKELFMDCGNIGITVSGSIVLNQPLAKIGTTQGTIVHRNVSLSTGSNLPVHSLFLTGSTLQSTKLGDSSYISFISNGSGQKILPSKSDCVFKPTLREKYGR